MSDLLTPAEAAEYLRVSVRTHDPHRIAGYLRATGRLRGAVDADALELACRFRPNWGPTFTRSPFVLVDGVRITDAEAEVAAVYLVEVGCKRAMRFRAGRCQQLAMEFPPPRRPRRPGRPGVPRPLRRAVIARDRHKCHWCRGRGCERLGPDGRSWHADHVLPVSLGGGDELANLVLACATCNQDRKAKPYDEYARIVRRRKRQR